MNSKELKAAFKTGERLYGTCVVAVPPSATIGAGLDFTFIDTEHTPIGRTKLAEMCRNYGALGMTTLVRIPSPDPFEACMVMDGGANGIIAPYIETPEQVRALAGAVKYRPLKGLKLAHFLETGELEPEIIEYLNKRNANNILAINLESEPGLANIDEIVKIKELDCIIVGPHDLSVSLGVPEQYTHPKFQKAIRLIFRKARENGISVGAHYSEDIEMQIAWAKEEDMNIILYNSDIGLFSSNYINSMNEIKRALSDETAKAGKGEII